MASTRLQTFNRWMSSNGVEHIPALDLIESNGGDSISVKSNSDLKEGDLVATIPKQACLTVRTSGASEMIEAAGLDGSLALSVAVMYERSLGSDSPWEGYLQLLPFSEPLPLLWSLDEIDSLLRGTELHKTVKEDKDLIYEDWKECIQPLIDSEEFTLDPNFFRVEDYFAAKSLVASRSFMIDDYHGSGMVPLADLFNHKTGAEDVHFSSSPSVGESDNSDESAESAIDDENDSNDEVQTHPSQNQENVSSTTLNFETSSDSPSSECSEGSTIGNPLVLEMILVNDVKAGAEVFNTYGLMGNAALLHRYGFTELDNHYDIVNIDLDLVLQWSSSLFSDHHTRSRLSVWRKLDYSGCVSDNSEYFEISFDGEPQLELLILLYIILLSQEDYTMLDVILATSANDGESTTTDLPKTTKFLLGEISEANRQALLTKSVRKALISLADMREGLYGESSLDDDIVSLNKYNCFTQRKFHHSFVLRVSERRVIGKLRSYVQGSKSLNGTLVHLSKKLKS